MMTNANIEINGNIVYYDTRVMQFNSVYAGTRAEFDVYFRLRRDCMRCRRCKTELRSDDEFCYHCGERTTIIQRMVASRMFIGSIIAIVLVAVIAVAAWLILTDRLALPFLEHGNKPDTPVVEQSDEPENTAGAVPSATETPEPTATPYVFEPGDVTEDMEEEIKPLLVRTRPFLAFGASYYARRYRPFKWDDVSASAMALYRLQFADKTIKYGDSYSSIKKKAGKEIKDVFGGKYKFRLATRGSFPDYVYLRSGNTIRFNSSSVSNRKYQMDIEKIIQYKEGKYRIVVKACLVSRTTGQEDTAQQYTLFVVKNESSTYGYTIDKIRLYKKGDKKSDK